MISHPFDPTPIGRPRAVDPPHWTLTMVFDEDYSRARSGFAGENLAILRQLEFNLNRRDKMNRFGGGMGQERNNQSPNRVPCPRASFAQRNTGHGAFTAPCVSFDYGGFIETALPPLLSRGDHRRHSNPPPRRSSRGLRRRRRRRRCPRRAAWGPRPNPTGVIIGGAEPRAIRPTSPADRVYQPVRGSFLASRSNCRANRR